MKNNNTMHLNDCFFTEKKRLLMEYEGLRVSLFRYETGVAALEVGNKRGGFIILPYQGQQIWRCCFDGRELTMNSMFDEPVRTRDYLSTYGGFFLHCGATAIGVPSKDDDHPLHGELPNAPYREAYISCGADENGSYIIVGGKYEHKVAFNHRYLAEPQVKIHENSSILDVSMQITNLLKTQMELMYLAHINFSPVDHAKLAYTADYDPQHVDVNINIPDHIKTSVPIGEFKAFLQKLKENPAIHHHIDPKALYDPEVVMSIQYKADNEGMAHSMQIHPDGYADYVAHRPLQLPKALRWIARNPNEDAMGLVLPATSGNNGYLAEKAAGNYITLLAGGSTRFDLRVGLLTPEESRKMSTKIDSIKGMA